MELIKHMIKEETSIYFLDKSSLKNIIADGSWKAAMVLCTTQLVLHNWYYTIGLVGSIWSCVVALL